MRDQEKLNGKHGRFQQTRINERMKINQDWFHGVNQRLLFSSLNGTALTNQYDWDS
jgi:hypothetical protein